MFLRTTFKYETINDQDIYRTLDVDARCTATNDLDYNDRPIAYLNDDLDLCLTCDGQLIELDSLSKEDKQEIINEAYDRLKDEEIEYYID